MKTWIVSLILSLAVLLTVPALAIEEEPAQPQETVTVEAETDDKNIVVNVTLPATVPAPTPEPTELPEISVVNDPEYMPYSTFSLDDAPAPGSTLSETVTALFGTYTPRTQTVTQQLTDGSVVTYQEIIPGLAGLDWPWLASVGLFALFLYGLLRIVGGLIKL